MSIRRVAALRKAFTLISDGSQGRTRMYKRTLCAIALAGLLAACAGSPEPSGNVTNGPASADAIKIEAGDNVFEPATLKAKSGDELVLEITNKGERAHDFVIESPKVSTGILAPGAVSTATFTISKGPIEYVCTLHRGMEGTIEVG